MRRNADPFSFTLVFHRAKAAAATQAKSGGGKKKKWSKGKVRSNNSIERAGAIAVGTLRQKGSRPLTYFSWNELGKGQE